MASGHGSIEDLAISSHRAFLWPGEGLDLKEMTRDGQHTISARIERVIQLILWQPQQGTTLKG